MPPSSNEKSPLERMRDRLYAPKTDSFSVKPLTADQKPAAQAGWAPPPPPPVKAPKKPGLPRAVLFLIIAGVFFVVAAVAAAALIIFGGRTVSTDNVRIVVTGPTTIGSGDTVPLLITIQNDNPVTLSSTRLMVDFPEGTRSADDIATPLSHYEDTVGEIASGGASERTVRAVLFGSENQRVRLPIRFEYRTEGSTTTFVKEAEYEFTISTSPLTVSVGALSQVSSGQPFSVDVAVRSNAVTPLANASVLAEYPPGFRPTATTPQPLTGSLFDLGTIAPGEEKNIRITGTLSGEDQDTRVFRFTVGTRTTPESPTLAVTYTTTQLPVTLEKPFLSTTLTLNRDTSGNTTVAGGATVEGILSYVNTLQNRIQDATIAITFGGSAFDPASIRTSNGFYRSSDSTLIFSKETLSTLADIAPGASGSGYFSFATKESTPGTALRNPTVTLSISVAGRRLAEGNVPQAVSSTITRTIKVNTDLSMNANAVYSTGPFKNTGPWPPKADQETTYTVEWTFANTVNSVADAKVTATLPSYVRFTGLIDPTSSGITYNETTRTVTWNAGDVPAGTSAKSARFQVALTPSASQRGTSPVLVSGQTFSGVDRFTSTKLGGAVDNLTTILENDPAFQFSRGQVE